MRDSVARSPPLPPFPSPPLGLLPLPPSSSPSLPFPLPPSLPRPSPLPPSRSPSPFLRRKYSWREPAGRRGVRRVLGGACSRACVRAGPDALAGRVRERPAACVAGPTGCGPPRGPGPPAGPGWRAGSAVPPVRGRSCDRTLAPHAGPGGAGRGDLGGAHVPATVAHQVPSSVCARARSCANASAGGGVVGEGWRAGRGSLRPPVWKVW